MQAFSLFFFSMQASDFKNPLKIVVCGIQAPPPTPPPLKELKLGIVVHKFRKCSSCILALFYGRLLALFYSRLLE